MTGATSPIVIPGPTTWEELEKCEHDFSREFHPPGYRGSDTNPGKVQHDGNKNRDKIGGYQCSKCGALRCGFGAEESVEAYIWHSLLVLRECYRVLRDDGVLWWNLGDSYARQAGDDSKKDVDTGLERTGRTGKSKELFQHGNNQPPEGMTGGNLIGVPHRFMLAAQADNWIVRNDCQWAKISCMPESVSGPRWERHRIKAEKSKHPRSQEGNKPLDSHHPGQVPHRDGSFDQPYDTKWVECPGCEKCTPNNGLVLRNGSWRHTRSHELVLMLTKGMNYWCDSEAVKEPAVHAGDDRKSRARKDHKTHPEAERSGIREGEATHDLSMKNPRNVLNVEPSESGHLVRLLNWLQDTHPEVVDELEEAERQPDTLLRPPPSGYTGNHFAAFPEGLISPLVLASTPRKCCPHCGAGWSPVVGKIDHGFADRTFRSPHEVETPGMTNGTGATTLAKIIEKRVSGYRQTCECQPHEPVPGIVLDPFTGSGTTGIVARELSLRFIGTDVSREYLEGQAMDRALRVTPSKKIEELPLFSGKQE